MNRRSALRMLGLGTAALAALPMVDVAALPALPAAPAIGDGQVKALADAIVRRMRDCDAWQAARLERLRIQALAHAYMDPCKADPLGLRTQRCISLDDLKAGDVVCITMAGASLCNVEGADA